MFLNFSSECHILRLQPFTYLLLFMVLHSHLFSFLLGVRRKVWLPFLRYTTLHSPLVYHYGGWFDSYVCLGFLDQRFSSGCRTFIHLGPDFGQYPTGHVQFRIGFDRCWRQWTHHLPGRLFGFLQRSCRWARTAFAVQHFDILLGRWSSQRLPFPYPRVQPANCRIRPTRKSTTAAHLEVSWTRSICNCYKYKLGDAHGTRWLMGRLWTTEI